MTSVYGKLSKRAVRQSVVVRKMIISPTSCLASADRMSIWPGAVSRLMVIIKRILQIALLARVDK
jgi:hypothetical protein